jgi:hypothetical protein
MRVYLKYVFFFTKLRRYVFQKNTTTPVLILIHIKLLSKGKLLENAIYLPS